jgi:alkanesulfonate monooxygenase SsuD/methylene tetrahydromethanopterin reductase-like flavin-dependent oxidoreductase (luciferase family)
MRTKRIRLMTGGVLPAFHHPIQLAAELSMVDALSNGRLEAGFARAYMPYEFEAFGVPMHESRERFEAGILAIMKLWTEEGVTLETPFFHFRNASCLPRPTQSPHPPIWVAASQSPQTFEWIGRQHFNLLCTMLLSSAETLRDLIVVYKLAFGGKQRQQQRTPLVAISLPLFVEETDTKAFSLGDHYLKQYFEVWEDAAKAWDETASNDYKGYTGMSQAIRSSSPDLLRKRCSVVMGCPERVVEQIQRIREELRVDLILWQVDFGGMPMRLTMNNLCLFIDRVLPNI